MKSQLHPTDYRTVVFEDLSNGFRFLTRSTIKTEDSTKWDDGQEYPLVKVHITSTSHPFFTGQEKLLDIEGRVDKFRARQDAAAAHAKARTDKAEAAKTKKKPAPKVDETKASEIAQEKPAPKAKKTEK